MKIDLKNPPRKFTVGEGSRADQISDCGSVFLEAKEQVTFVTESGREYDVCRKSWGYYATPSTNQRLKKFGMRTALVRNSVGNIYIMIVEEDKLSEFHQYCTDDPHDILFWLDDPEDIDRLLKKA